MWRGIQRSTSMKPAGICSALKISPGFASIYIRRSKSIFGRIRRTTVRIFWAGHRTTKSSGRKLSDLDGGAYRLRAHGGPDRGRRRRRLYLPDLRVGLLRELELHE